MSAKEKALRTIHELSDDCSWAEVLGALSAQAGAWGPGGASLVREFRVPWGATPPAEQTSHTEAEEGEMSRDYDVLIERDTEGFYVASVPALRGCHTQARTLDLLLERVREAIELCVEVGAPAAETEFVGVRRVSVPA
ncbi:MAG TPA: type II toxin-antitoxin system HicB family antitoxin [Longimicrobiaceae bacterium]|nr:type II toxin-antitoxin system HicB family antitoxin [Longimicrobiaceae bacterium]